MPARPEWLVLPGDPGYASIRRRYVGRHDRMPSAVARCRTTADVVRALKYARQEGLEIAIRSSGHSYADHSSTGGLLLDMSTMSETVVGPHTVTVGTGQTLGRLSDTLAAQHRLVPGGSCPTVAIGGIALAGGFGYRGRLHGLTTDQIVRAEIVLADGSVVEADPDHHAELFWALRGAGAGSFGVVTSLELKTYPLTEMWGCYASWPLEHAVTVLDAWQRWAPHLPGDASIEAYLVATDYDDEPAHVEIWGVSSGTRVLAEALALISVPPWKYVEFDLSSRHAARYLSGWMIRANEPLWVPDGPFERSSHAYVKSGFFDRPVPPEALAELVVQFVAGRVYGEYRDIEFTPWRGAYSRDGDNAFIHRNPLCLISHTVLRGTSAGPRQLRDAQEWLTASWSVLRPHGNGHVYQGYPDPDLEDWAHAYYGSGLDRLRRVKAVYDQDNVFRFAQSL